MATNLKGAVALRRATAIYGRYDLQTSPYIVAASSNATAPMTTEDYIYEN